MEGKPQTTKEKDADALTFVRTVIMFFVREMEHGEQTLPTNDLFVHLPVQILPDLVVVMERQSFTPAEVKGGCGYQPKEEGAQRFAPWMGDIEQWVQADHNALFKKPLWAELLPAEAPDSDAFDEELGVPRLRHVSVEGIRLIGAEAWQNCRQLRIVKKFHVGMSTSLDACSLRCINFA